MSHPRGRTVNVVLKGATDLPLHYVNALNVNAGTDEVYLTFGQASLAGIDKEHLHQMVASGSMEGKALFCCVASTSTLRQMIEIMTAYYNQQADPEHGRKRPTKKESEADHED